MPHIFSVRELTQSIKEVLEGEFPFLWVKGQVSNISHPSSGHIYFTLKDDEACLNIVWFKSNQKFWLNSSPEKINNGMEIVCAGRLTVYAPRGTYQLIAELVQDKGIGQLHLEFEALKKKLSEQGYFDSRSKKSLPSYPEKIGVITAPTGAAIQDFLKIASNRGWTSCIRIFPSLVQGEGACENIVFVLEQANLEQWAELLVIIRGGGSLEDLWTFNTEPVAKAIYCSNIPVLTGIGHETDLTIADLVADVQAATPTHAAQIIWPERSSLTQQLDELEINLKRAWKTMYQNKLQELQSLEKGLSWLSPLKRLRYVSEHIDYNFHSMWKAVHQLIRTKEDLLDNIKQDLYRVYSPRSFDYQVDHINNLIYKLKSSIRVVLAQKEKELELTTTELNSSNPLQPLQRGYCLVRIVKNGEILKSADQVTAGDQIDIQTNQDHILAKVEQSN